MRTMDMARFGFLYLNGGFWNNTEVIQTQWILNSTTYHILVPRYGYLWWLEPIMGVYQASGRLGQRIMVNPKEEMVVVFTGSIEGINYHPHDELYTDYILESIIGPPRIIEESTSESSNQTTMTNHTGSSDGLIDMQLMMIS